MDFPAEYEWYMYGFVHYPRKTSVQIYFAGLFTVCSGVEIFEKYTLP